jgi:acetylornithine/succinyldiaminopimelate/putrescine aminotransferase
LPHRRRFAIASRSVTLAKALANGLPIGVLHANALAATGFQSGDHGSTFGGSPIPCAAALAHLRLRDELNLDAHVLARSWELFHALTQLAEARPTVLGRPRGMGLLIGSTVFEPYEASAVVEAAREQGLLIGNAAGNTLRFAPPLIISEQEVARAASLLGQVIEAF